MPRRDEESDEPITAARAYARRSSDRSDLLIRGAAAAWHASSWSRTRTLPCISGEQQGQGAVHGRRRGVADRRDFRNDSPTIGERLLAEIHNRAVCDSADADANGGQLQRGSMTAMFV